MNPHYILCDGKIPVGRWKENRPGRDEAMQHLKSGGNVGIVPGSVGMAVLDLDSGDPDELLKQHPPAFHYKTPSGGMHLWYVHPGGKIGNGKWELCGCSGEVRADRGYVVLWSRKEYSEWQRASNSPWFDKPFPVLAPVIPSSNGRPKGRAYCEAVIRNLRDTAPGERNEALNRAAYSIRTNAEDPNEWSGRLVDAGISIGLPEHEAMATVASGLGAAPEARRGPAIAP